MVQPKNKRIAVESYVDAAVAAATAPVQSVAGKTGAVTLAKADVGLGSVDNTSDASKPVSTATQTALDGKAATSHTHTASQITNFNSAVQAVPGFGGGGSVSPPLEGWVASYGWKVGSIDPSSGTKNPTPAANQRWGVKMYSAVPWSASKIDVLVQTPASTDATGYRIAVYDASMNLVVTTGDVSARFMSANINYFKASIPLPSTINMAAGRYFVAFRWGAGTTRAAIYCGNSDVTQTQNAGMVWDANDPANFYRLFTFNGDWSGESAPANGAAFAFCDRNFSLPIFGLG